MGALKAVTVRLGFNYFALVRSLMAELLDDENIESQLPAEWERDGDEIVRTYEFDEYLEGVAFATNLAEIAEAEFHHPELTIGYKKVEVRLTSHEEGGITDQDVHMAELFEREAEQ